jgi:subtilase family serine protease
MLDRLLIKAPLLFLSAVMLSLAGLATPLQAATQSRIRTAIVNSETAELPQTVSPRARAAADLGTADAKLVLSDMTLHFSLTDTAQAALTELLLEQQQPASANYHKWLTPELFADQFGLSTDDLAKVTAWLSSQGFTVTSTSRSRTFVTFSGTAAQVQQAFGTSIHTLSLNDETHFANLTDPVLPSAIAGVVTGMTGLNDFKLAPRAKSHMVPTPATDTVHAQFTSSVSGSIYVAPADFYTIYDENPLITNGVNGSGVTIAVVGQTDISLADVAAFRSASGLSVNAPTVLLVPSSKDPGISTDDLTEAQLDVEWSGAVAPSAKILYVNSTNVIGTSLVYAIDNNLAPVISVSYGLCESGWGQSALNSMNLEFQKANSFGISIVGPSGDSGAADCDYNVASASQGLAVDFPASSPYVTGLGGTMFNDGSANQTYWAAANSAAYNGSGSALSYIPESVWNESTTTGIAAAGGGISAYFSKPAWQVGTGVRADSSRDVPDVSLNAASSHESSLICSAGSCVNGFRTSSTPTTSCTTGGCLNVVGGTSVAAPEFAGLLSLVVQQTGARIGNANPILYALANSTYYASVFHDVTTGNNSVPCTSGSTGCPTSLTLGYSAGTGYDVASGWGSVDAYNMVNDWKLVTPLSAGVGQTLTNTTLTTTTANVVQGTAITLTARVAAVATSAATPTGTVQLLVDNVVNGSPVALASGSATLTLATTALTAGAHTVSVSYSGDTTFAGSKGNATVDITSAASPDFSITGTPTTVTIKAGGSGAATYTLASLNGFAGSVTMSATASSSLNASGSFSVSPVTVTTTTAGTTVFSLNAYTTNGTALPAGRLAQNRKPTWMVATGGMAFASMLLILVPGRKRRRLSRSASIFCMLMLSVAAIGMSGCSGSSGLASVTSSTTNTTPGTYVITITGTSGAVSHSTNLTLVVQ